MNKFISKEYIIKFTKLKETCLESYARVFGRYSSALKYTFWNEKVIGLNNSGRQEFASRWSDA
jgi:hypothetical protein